MHHSKNEERFFKSFIKKKIRFNLENFIKFLITGLVSLSLTACGGGGGGGGNNNSQNTTPIPPINPPTNEVEINQKNESYSIKNQDIKLSGNISGDKKTKSLVGVNATNSNIESIANIKLEGNDSIGIYGDISDQKSIYTINNKGSIELTGNKSIGIVVNNGVIAINEGNILGKGIGVEKKDENGQILDEFGSIGIAAFNGSKAINNGNISLEGAYSIGMFADKKSEIENNGDISLSSKLVIEGNIESHNEPYVEEEVYSTERGMRADNSSKAVNKGNITGKGQITGIDVSKQSIGINDGNITLNSLSQIKDTVIDSTPFAQIIQKETLSKVTGLKAKDKGSQIINNKNIQLSGYAIGMFTTEKAEGINNGNIILNSQKINAEGYSKNPDNQFNEWQYKEIGTIYSDLIGMSADKNSTITNGKTGIISLNGTGSGMRVNRSSIATNFGDIILESQKESWSDSISPSTIGSLEQKWLNWSKIIGMDSCDSTIINNGKIKILNNGIGMFGNNSTITNNNIIEIEVNDLSTNPQYQAGMSSAAIYGINNSSILNDGTIKITGNKIVGIYNYGGQISTGINSNISLTGSGMTGIYSANNSNINNNGSIFIDVTNNSEIGSNGILVEGNGNVTNKGDIKIHGNKIKLNSNSSFDELISKISTGITIESIEDHSKNNNEGINYKDSTISISGSAIGMYSKNSNIENKGNINIANNTFLEDEIASIGMATNGGSATNNGKITSNTSYSQGLFAFNNGHIINGDNGNIAINGDNVEAMSVSGNGNATNNGKIWISGNKARGMEIDGGTGINNGTIDVNGNGAIGMAAYENSSITNDSNGIINVGEGTTGMNITDNGSAINNGKINVKKGNIASSGIAIKGNGHIQNNGNITVESNNLKSNFDLNTLETKLSTGIYVLDSNNNSIVNNQNGNINISGSAIGIYSKNSNIENKGNINIANNTFSNDEIASIGMATNGGSATNNGKITSNTSYSQGLFAFNNGHIINGDNGNIAINGDNVEAMSVSGNGKATNNGKIRISGNKARGMEIDGGTGINNGTIDVHGNGAIGMAAYENSSITNDSNGIINVGEGAIGMVASGTNASAINKGIIKVTSKAEGGMRAFDGGTIYNQGIIKVDVNHVGNKENIAIFADNNSTLINKGKIETNGNVIIESNATYIIGNDSKGNFGKLISKDVKLDGNLLISTEIVKGSYQNSYVFDDIVKSENIEFGENYRSLSSSILYDVKTSKDENGNLDGQLIRNTNTLSKFTNKQFYKVGDLFDKYLDKNKYATLSKQEQDLVDKVFSSTNSPYKINDTIEKLSGKEYLNIPQQIFDIKDNFIKYDNSIIATLDKYNYNFTLIGEYQDIQTKEATIGYDSKMSGFTGAVKLSDNLYGTLGYSYTNIDYNNNSKGNIQTIHSSLYKDYNYNNFKTKYGLFGEFNFHETDRVGIENNIKTDYNSYIVGINGEISKKFGKDLYIQPKISLDISYGKLKEFKDENTLKIKDQNYNSVLPKFEITAGKKFNHIELFTKSSYSYEFGNLDKDMDIEILRKDLSIENTSSNREKIDISVGSNINFDNVSFNIQAGKEFGKRDRNYISAGINYKF